MTAHASSSESIGRRKAKALLDLGRVSNLPTVWSNLIVAVFLASGGIDPPGGWIVLLGLGGTLLYVGGTTLNDFFDASFDRRYRKERPIPQGIWSRQEVGWWGFAYLAAGTAMMVFAGCHWVWLTALLIAILVYDWIHKRWTGAVLVMGLCRGFLVLAVISSRSPEVRPMAWAYVGSLIVYIVGITLTARGESGHVPARRRRLPSAILLGAPAGTVAVMIVGAMQSTDGLAYTRWPMPAIACAAGAFVLMLYLALRRLADTDDARRIGACVSLLLAGIVLLDSLFLSLVVGWWWLIAALLFPLALAWQRRVDAT